MKRKYFVMQKSVLKALLSLVILLAAALLFPSSAALSADEITVTTEEELREAIISGADVISVNSIIHIYRPIDIRTEVTITGNGVIEVRDDFRHFIVHQEAALTLEGNVTLRRAEIPSETTGRGAFRPGGGITVSGGTLIMRGGILTGNSAPEEEDVIRWDMGILSIDGNGIFRMYSGKISRNQGSAVRINDNSVFTMYDGEISLNRGVLVRGRYGYNPRFHMHGGRISENGGSGVYVLGGSFRLYDGIISNNRARSGGGVSLSGATFTMYDGEITNNESLEVGGGIAAERSRIVLHNGIIADNLTQYTGGGIDLRSNSALIMHGGEILNNTVVQHGGGGVFFRDSNGTMHGGRISGNQAHENGGGVQIFGVINASTFNVTGGEITDNIAAEGGGIHIMRPTNPDNVTVLSEAVFRNNRADSRHNLGLSAGRERFPQIAWSGDNSIPGTHLFNNYDISYTGQWTPAIWMIYLAVAALILFGKTVFIIAYKIKDRRSLKAGDSL